MVKDIEGFQIVLKFDTSSLSVSTVHRPYLALSFGLFTWNQMEDGIVIVGIGSIEKNSEGPVANIFFKTSEEALGNYNLTFDVQETILACACSVYLELEIIDGSLWVGYWDQWYYRISPRRLNFGSVEIDQADSLRVNISRDISSSFVVDSIISDHPDFTVSPKSFVVNPLQTKQFLVTFSPSEIGTTSALITIESPNTVLWDDQVIAVGAGSLNPTDVNSDEHDHYEEPENFELYQNWPNPFNSETDVRYQIGDSKSLTHTTLKIFNVLGQELRTLIDEMQGAGFYSVNWDGRDNFGNIVPNGLYFYQLRSGNFVQTKKCLLLK
ncbi:MAG: T9SS type A sorting domain-containing protein [bacterium]